jgi:hypothetical protein
VIRGVIDCSFESSDDATVSTNPLSRQHKNAC